MRNIFVIETDKPSRLVKFFTNKYHLCKEVLPIQDEEQYQNIYITNDAVIKDGDYSFYPPFGVGKNIFIDGELCFHIESKDGKGSFTQRTYQTLDKNKKIILTIDQNLIGGGVQAIDEEFLEWFCKNSSCEFVETQLIPVNEFGSEITVGGYGFDKFIYKIIIPQEQPKQETLEEALLRIGLMEIELKHTKTLLASCEKALENRDAHIERMYSEANKIMEFLDTEKKLKFLDVKTIERIKWYFETYFVQFKKKNNGRA
jgi:hypothetical protein